MGRKRKYEIGYDRNKAWKERNNFERSEHRKGYKAGYNRARSGNPMTDLSDRRSEEYQAGYRAGFEAGSKQQ